MGSTENDKNLSNGLRQISAAASRFRITTERPYYLQVLGALFISITLYAVRQGILGIFFIKNHPC